MPVRGTPLSLIDWQILAQIEVEENCDYVDFVNLDINRDWEYYLDAVIKNPTVNYTGYLLFVEGDYTAANYYNQYIHGDGTNIVAARSNNPCIGFLFGGTRGLFNVRITRDPYGYFRYISAINRNTGSTQELVIRFGSKTAPVSNITSLRVSAEVSGAIGAGSRFILARPRS